MKLGDFFLPLLGLGGAKLSICVYAVRRRRGRRNTSLQFNSINQSIQTNQTIQINTIVYSMYFYIPSSLQPNADQVPARGYYIEKNKRTRGKKKANGVRDTTLSLWTQLDVYAEQKTKKEPKPLMQKTRQQTGNKVLFSPSLVKTKSIDRIDMPPLHACHAMPLMCPPSNSAANTPSKSLPPSDHRPSTTSHH